jgi:hypothetical protein
MTVILRSVVLNREDGEGSHESPRRRASHARDCSRERARFGEVPRSA